MSLPVVDAVAKVRTTDGRQILLRVNQGLYQPGSSQSLMSTPQVRDAGTRVDTTWVQHDSTSNFGIVLQSEEYGRLVVPFTIDGASSGFSISSPDDDELEELPIFEITSSLHWDPSSNSHAENEARSQKQRDFEAHDRAMFASRENRRLRGGRRVNLSAAWSRPTDSRLVSIVILRLGRSAGRRPATTMSLTLSLMSRSLCLHPARRRTTCATFSSASADQAR